MFKTDDDTVDQACDQSRPGLWVSGHNLPAERQMVEFSIRSGPCRESCSDPCLVAILAVSAGNPRQGASIRRVPCVSRHRSLHLPDPTQKHLPCDGACLAQRNPPLYHFLCRKPSTPGAGSTGCTTESSAISTVEVAAKATKGQDFLSGMVLMESIRAEKLQLIPASFTLFL